MNSIERFILTDEAEKVAAEFGLARFGVCYGPNSELKIAAEIPGHYPWKPLSYLGELLPSDIGNVRNVIMDKLRHISFSGIRSAMAGTVVVVTPDNLPDFEAMSRYFKLRTESEIVQSWKKLMTADFTHGGC